MAESRVLKKWQKGEVFTAAGVNDIQDLLQSVTHAAGGTPGGNRTILWLRLKQWIGPESNFVDRTAALQYYDTATDKWKDASPEQEITLVVDPFGGMTYAQGMIIPVQAHGAGKYVPLWPGLTNLGGKMDEYLAPGQSATMSIYWRDSGANYQDTGINVEVYLRETELGIPTGNRVTASFRPPRGASFPGFWEVIAGSSNLLGKADGAIAAGAEGTISIYTGTPGSETDSGQNIEHVRNRTSVNIPSLGWVHVLEINGKPYCEPWSC